MSKSDAVSVNNVSKLYGRVGAVNGVSLAVKQGEILSVIGPSGCGKTTLLRSIAGLEEIDGGEITIDGKVVSSPEKKISLNPEDRNIGLVFQSYALWPNMKVKDNVAFGLVARKFPKQDVKKRVDVVLEQMGLKGLEDRYPSQLSGGQQQRVSLARSIAYSPSLILLDEPLSNLDLRERERVRTELKKELYGLGTAALYVTHDQEEAFVLSHRVIIMNHGKLVQEGTPRELYENPKNEFVANFVGKSNMFTATLKNSNHSGATLSVSGIEGILEIGPGKYPDGEYKIILRPNEMGISGQKPNATKNVLKGVVKDRSYRGSVTDHAIQIGDSELVLTTHRFCSFANEVDDRNVYITVPERAITIIPKGDV